MPTRGRGIGAPSPNEAAAPLLPWYRDRFPEPSVLFFPWRCPGPATVLNHAGAGVGKDRCRFPRSARCRARSDRGLLMPRGGVINATIKMTNESDGVRFPDDPARPLLVWHRSAQELSLCRVVDTITVFDPMSEPSRSSARIGRYDQACSRPTT